MFIKKKLTLRFAALIILLLPAMVLHAQVAGRVIDAENNKPLANVSIYLDGTSTGTTSNTNGDFKLNTTQANIPLIVSYVGYTSQTITNYAGKNLQISLRLKATELKEVVIGAPAAISRKDELKVFLTQFIGSTNDDCIITNPDDISFSYRNKTKQLVASADKPLLIHNKKLGYNITYFLSAFKYSPIELSFQGNYFFGEDTLGLQSKEVKKILKARDNVYYGSRMHFIRSLWADNLNMDNFTVRNQAYNFLNYEDLVVTHDNTKFVALPGQLFINYDGQNSSIRPQEKVIETLITDNGFNTNNVIWTGEMANQRINKLLPFEFMPLPSSKNAPKYGISSIASTGGAGTVNTYINYINGTREKMPIEKLHLQLDKPYYVLGDTIRFKAYLVNADYLTPAKSGLLYIELDNASNFAIKRIVVPVYFGVSWGDIALDEKDIPEGSYTIRAYTNWMRNFGEDYIFKKNIYVSALSGSTLVKANFKLDTTSNNNKIQAKLYFASLDKNPLRLKDMRLQVKNGTHNLAHYQASTGVDGSTEINFDLVDKAAVKNLTIRAHQTGKGADTANLIIPVTLNRPEKTDLQFMPEGGNLVAGKQVKVGFKAISEDGKGVNISGKILDSKQQEVSTFKSTHLGMGSFEFTPQAGEKYFARVSLLNGTSKTYPLPVVNPTGTVLKITSKGNDSLIFAVTAKPGINSPSIYNIIGQSRGVVCYAAWFSLTSGTISGTIAKQAFPTGITRFTLLNQTNQPLNERLVYIGHNDNLRIAINTNKASYTTRDSISLALQVNDKDGEPVQGAFSLAVTDDTQIKTDSTGINIVNNLLFTSDLKGNIEQPGYYFNNIDVQKQADLDNLLLTQGWVGYDWKKVFDIKRTQLAYTIEKEFVVQGKVTNLFNKPIKQTKVMVLRKNPLLVMDTLTDNNGRFAFKGNGLLPADSAFFFIEALNKNGRSNLVGVEVDEFTPPEFAPSKETIMPWYVNSDSTLLNNSHTKSVQLDAEANYRGEGHRLKEVIIKEKKLIPGSQNPDAEYDDVVWDQKDMDAAKKMTLLEFLEHKYAVVRIGNPNVPTYLLKGHYILRLYIDGLPGTPTDLYVNYLTVEDIKGIEVRYVPTIGSFDYAIMHITTHSGNGKFYRHTPGTYAYKPIPFSAPKEFYRPQYTAKNISNAIGTDLRSTIHWEPNIITDKDGKATVSFFSADKTATYSIIMEGTDLKGNIGYKKESIKVGKTMIINAELHRKIGAQ